ncbi:hypothetical protein R3P38DRAFT_3443704 [Favolaschia claudopus]|uniref:F-box domain-containing protein n=1 Tax=Favolaschia claudopus TaxID=2862362 RepID=A0AAV9ZQM5_9AGAR
MNTDKSRRLDGSRPLDIHPESSGLEKPLDPRLPQDLERSIFELAAASSTSKEVLVLMRIAWRVKDWLQPLLYRTIVPQYFRPMVPTIPLNVALDLLQGEGSQAMEYSVRSLCWHLTDPSGSHNPNLALHTIIESCPNISDLCLVTRAPRESVLILDAMQHLLRLNLDARHLFAPERPEYGSALFRNVTHLELFEEAPYLDTDLSTLVNLTHLALNIVSDVSAFHSRICTDTRLQCIDMPTLVDDRVVGMYGIDFIQDWIRGVTTGDDFWRAAERFIAARRIGKVDRSHNLVAYDDAMKNGVSIDSC